MEDVLPVVVVEMGMDGGMIFFPGFAFGFLNGVVVVVVVAVWWCVDTFTLFLIPRRMGLVGFGFDGRMVYRRCVYAGAGAVYYGLLEAG